MLVLRHARSALAVKLLSNALLALLLAVGCGESGSASSSLAPSASLGSPSLDGWNTAQIDWRPYQEGLAEAQQSNKPIVLVFFTSWCGHCKNYSHIFEDQRVVAQSKQFVMIRLDKDQNRELSKKYALDGEYIPRTFVLRPDGTVREDIQERRDKFKYFYDEKRPENLLVALERGLSP